MGALIGLAVVIYFCYDWILDIKLIIVFKPVDSFLGLSTQNTASYPFHFSAPKPLQSNLTFPTPDNFVHEFLDL
jgi:hypothetical protein